MQTLAVGNTSGLTTWIQQNVLGLVILIIGVVVIMAAHKKNLSNAITMISIVVLGLLVVGLSANGNGVAVGQWLSNLAFG